MLRLMKGLASAAWAYAKPWETVSELRELSAARGVALPVRMVVVQCLSISHWVLSRPFRWLAG